MTRRETMRALYDSAALTLPVDTFVRLGDRLAHERFGVFDFTNAEYDVLKGGKDHEIR